MKIIVLHYTITYKFLRKIDKQTLDIKKKSYKATFLGLYNVIIMQ